MLVMQLKVLRRGLKDRIIDSQKKGQSRWGSYFYNSNSRKARKKIRSTRFCSGESGGAEEKNGVQFQVIICS
ncbi:hypothetical protein MHYP_G00167630 [Metynnis hypsauchen]